jgi:hypothetical protein
MLDQKLKDSSLMEGILQKKKNLPVGEKLQNFFVEE